MRNAIDLKAMGLHPYERERTACDAVGMGRTAFRAWAKEIGARRKVGKILLYDMLVILGELQKGGDELED